MGPAGAAGPAGAVGPAGPAGAAGPAGPAGGTGLFGASLSGVPTAAGTGLAAWLNQGSAAVADSAAGICITDTSGGGAQRLRGRIKAAPATPYTVKALVSFSGQGNSDYCGIGWYDGTNKLHVIGPHYFNGWLILVGKLNSPTSYNSNDQATGSGQGPMVWLKLGDDGTTVTFSYSYDGENFVTLASVAKATGFLGAAGYSNLVFFGNAQNSAMQATLLSWS